MGHKIGDELEAKYVKYLEKENDKLDRTFGYMTKDQRLLMYTVLYNFYLEGALDASLLVQKKLGIT